MKEYIVLKGQTVHENGQIYKAGDTFVTTTYRAEQLGLGTKIEEVEVKPQAPGTDPRDAKIEELQTKLTESEKTSKSVIESTDKKLQEKDSEISDLKADLTKLAKEKNDSETAMGNEIADLKSQLEKKDSEISDLSTQKAPDKKDSKK